MAEVEFSGSDVWRRQRVGRTKPKKLLERLRIPDVYATPGPERRGEQRFTGRILTSKKGGRTVTLSRIKDQVR
ncbi:MAG: hypothetical protein IPM54_31030, partial [Polyangiaceae bacterium]|nr:hypothetical protein [Polyangiaceae bacterium]